MANKITRRDFVTDVALTGAGFAIVPRHVLGRGQTAPSDRLNVAAVGVGGQGRSDLVNLATENIVALCDVDWDYADKGFAALDTDIASQEGRLDRQHGALAVLGRRAVDDGLLLFLVRALDDRGGRADRHGRAHRA